MNGKATAIKHTFDALDRQLWDGLCRDDAPPGESKSEREYIAMQCKLIAVIREALADLRKRAEDGEFD